MKKVLLAMALVLFGGQFALKAQSLADAERLIKLEKYSEAQSVLEKVIAEDPRNDKADYLMGRVFFLQDQMNEADTWFRKGQGHSGRNPMNFIGAGAVAAKNQNFDKAKSELDKASELNTKADPKIVLEVAKAYLEYPGKDKQKMQPFLNAAEPLLINVQQKSPKDPEPEILLGQLYGMQGVEELEQSRYEAAIEKDPNYIFGYVRLGQLYKKQEKYQEAAEKFKKAIEIDPGYGPAYREMAEMWTLAKKYDLADQNMTKYLEIMGADVDALLKKGTIEYLGGQYDKAIKTLEGIAGKSKSLLVPRLIGYSYAKKENPDAAKAIEWLDKYFAATKDNPSNIIASDYENYGKALQVKGDVDGAIGYYQKAIDKAAEKGEPNADLYMTIADIYKEKKDDTMRVVYLSKFLNSSSKYQLKESFALGQTYFLMGDYVHSDSIFEVMCTKMPTLHIGWSWRARSNAAMDPESKEGKAMPYYEKVIELLGSDPEKAAKYSSDYVLALRYFGAYHTLVDEKFSEAIGFWEKILEISPEDEGAKNGIEYCKQKGG